MNLAANLHRSARLHPDRTALSCGDRTISYTEFLQLSQRIAGVMRASGVRPDTTIGLVSSNVPAFPVVFYGALLAGCSVVPLSPQLTARELIYFFEDSHAQMVLAHSPDADAADAAARQIGLPLLRVTGDGLPESWVRDTQPIEEAVHRSGDDTAVILYTSGTTGQPKGAMLTHDNLNTNAWTMCETILESDQHDVMIICLPLFHVFGLSCGINAAVVAGAESALVPKFDSSVVADLIGSKGATLFAGVPTMYSAMLNDPGTHELSSLRVCLSGGAALPLEVLHGFERRYGATIYEGYGLSETSPAAVFNRPSIERREGSVGLAVRGTDVRIVDSQGVGVAHGVVGEIVIRGECVMAGYFGRPEATAEAIPDGWFRSGDLGRMDEDGYLYIVDRKKQMIIRGGYNVYPRQIEEVLYEHPAIREVAVIGLEHSRLGEEIGAAVVIREGFEFSQADVQEFCRERIAGFQRPRHIWEVRELPKNAVGKILHRSIRPPVDLTVE
ncbi:long-chain fatty acid--CoA ligase [Rhodococcus jostii]|uniref:long-chain-fatty-acid--CoA ligase n=1 Tax=Rhodococcus jostii TaxID=132919 RepID=UPI003649CE33